MNTLTWHTLSQSLPGGPRRVALGIFDGLHVGHRAVLSHTLDGEELPTVLTLTNAAKASAPLLSEEETAKIFGQIGIRDWIRMDIDLLKHLSPTEFVEQVLRDTLNATAVCCGYNYRFGKDRAGDVDTLRALCAQNGITVTVVPPVEVDGQPVSSTRIRGCIAAGDMLTATRLLGYPYTLTAPVEHGHQLGRKLGFPTINQRFPADRPVPRHGVYASAVLVDGHTTYGVTNIGCHPTVNPAETPLAETWLPAFEGDLYGHTVSVSPLYFLRPEQSFDSLEALTAAVRENGEQARRLFDGDPGDHTVKAVLFDFDDTLHDRRMAFEDFAYALLGELFPQWDDNLRRERAHRMMVANNGGYVPSYEAYFEGLLTEWEWPPEWDAVALANRTRRLFPDYTHPFPDAVATLKALRERGYRLGMVTNGYSQTQNRKVDVVGMRELVDVVVVSGDEGIAKPEAELFRRAAARLGVPLQNCLYVGDHPVNDIKGALNSGMQAVYMDAFEVHAADPTVPRITALSELIGILS